MEININSQLTSINSQISIIQSYLIRINNDISAIDSCVIHPELQNIIDIFRNRLIEKRNTLNENLSELLLELGNYTFNQDQQSIIDQINILFENKYKELLFDFQFADIFTKNQFFHLYSLADNDILRECIIIQFFHLPLIY
jgi:disulfide oxidoreductase YuzD